MKASSTFVTRSICSVAAVAALGGAGLSMAPGAHADTPPAPQTVNYTGNVQWVTVPAGVHELNINAIGGDGGVENASNPVEGAGADVSGMIPVTPGQKIGISVGGMGQAAGTNTHDPRGGWGGLGMGGGNGNGASSDYLRTSAAGGGATTIQIENADGYDLHTVLIAAGGGGGSGSSATYGMTNTGIKERGDNSVSNGQVVLTWADN